MSDVDPSIEYVRLLHTDGHRWKLYEVHRSHVKKTKFSDQGIEALITAPEISGHKYFVGGGSRPNLLTWFITMNGPSLSRDLAQRTINIVLKRPNHTGNWIEQVNSHVSTYRDEIVSVTLEFRFYRGKEIVAYDMIKLSGAGSREKVLRKMRKKVEKR
jgi:hypothetical protein